MSAATCSCGCCSGVAARTPLELQNRPGLTAVAYRVGVHSDFLASMIAGLTNPERPGLAALGTRDDDDFSIALFDAWAVAADVLAFYNERLAQESYLRTARQRISLQELGKLIGYRLDPGVAAQTYVAFALEPPPGVPAAASQDPGSAPPVTPASVTLETGLRVQSIPRPGEQPQTFETVEAIEARPEWNAIPASTTLPQTFTSGATHAHFQHVTLNLKPGDPILLAGSDVVGERWDVRTLTAVTLDAPNDRTRVDWVPGVGSESPRVDPAPVPRPYVFRKRCDVFGHNAPMWLAMSSDFRTNYPGYTESAQEWPSFVIADAPGTCVDLDGSHPDVVAGSWVVLSKPSYRELWQVLEVVELNRAAFAISGKVTRLTLTGGENYRFFSDQVRNLTVFAVSEELTLSEQPDQSDVSGGWVDVDADVSGIAAGHRLILRGVTTTGEEHADDVVVKSVERDGEKWRLLFANDLSTRYERNTAIVHANVALVTHGETVQELLGSGQGRAAFQRFKLSHGPLTHVQSSSDPTGKVDTLEVRVNDVSWREVPTLFGAGARDRSFVLRTDETGAAHVQFGNGVNGSRLPSGVNNVRATYRKGLGAAGNVGAGAIAQLIDRPLGVKGASNPSGAAGGVDPETEDAARTSIPLGVRTLGRAVSLPDYEDFARAFSGVVKANAAILPLRSGRTILVTVAFEGGDRIDDLTTALRRFGDPHVQVLVVDGATETFRIALKVAVDPAYETDVVLSGVEGALRAAYAFDARDFVDPVFLSQIDAVAHGVAGVFAVDVDRLYRGAIAGLSDRLLAQRPGVGAGGAAIPAGLLLLDSAPFDWLEQLT